MQPHYDVLRLIGEGGMGRVYEAVHQPSGIPVALKMVARAARDPGMRRLLLDEATAAAQVVHPNIVRLYDVGRDVEGDVFLVMELVRGHDLEAWIRRWPGWDHLLSALQGVTAGLAAAHSSGIVHGDIKPSNVLIAADGLAKLTDFGVAEMVDPLSGSTERRGIAGTPLYMPPEQMNEERVPGPWSDLYALGVVLHEIVGGRAPFDATTMVGLYQAKLRGAPPLAPRTGVEAPQQVHDLLARLLEPHPRKRLRFAAEVGARLREIEALVVGRDTMMAPAMTIETAAASLAPPTVVDLEPVVKSGSTAILLADAPPPSESSPVSSRRLPFSLPSDSAAGPGLAIGLLRPPPLVGRGFERDRLMDQAAEIRGAGGTRALVLLGGAGVGKSRIARVGLAEVERLGLMEGVAAGYDASGTSLAGGLKHALRRLLALGPRASGVDDLAWLGDESAPAIARWLRDDDPMALQQSVGLAHLAIRALSRITPVYLWLDDVGWSRDGAADLVLSLLAAQDARVLIVATMRRGTADHPEVRAWIERLAEHPRVRFEQLGTLARADRRALIESIAPIAPEVAETVSGLDETPLVLVQAVREWIESGMLVAGPRGFEPKPGTSAAVLLLGRSDVSVIAQRIDAMLSAYGDRAAAAETVLLRMALLGVRFTEPLLRATALPGEDAMLDEVLDRSLIVGLLRLEAERTYRFDHGLFQEALLTKLAGRADRGTWNALVARALVSSYGEHNAELQIRAAELYRAAGARDEAANSLRAAGRGFARAGMFDRARAMVDQLAREAEEDAVPPVHKRRSHTLRARAALHYFQSTYPEALADLMAADAMLTALGDELGAFEVRLEIGNVYFYQDRLRDSESIALALEARLGAFPRLAGGIYRRLADLAAMRGDLDGALAKELTSEAEARARGDAWRVLLNRIACTELCLAADRLEEALRYQALALTAYGSVDQEMRAEVDDLGVRVAIAQGSGGRYRMRVAQRIDLALSQRDEWRLTSFRLLDALIEGQSGTDEHATRAAVAFLDAYRRMRHDEAFSWWGMGKLASLLEARGQQSLGHEVRAVLENRKREVQRAFSA